MQKSKDSLKDCFKNVNILLINLSPVTLLNKKVKKRCDDVKFSDFFIFRTMSGRRTREAVEAVRYIIIDDFIISQIFTNLSSFVISPLSSFSDIFGVCPASYTHKNLLELFEIFYFCLVGSVYCFLEKW